MEWLSLTALAQGVPIALLLFLMHKFYNLEKKIDAIKLSFTKEMSNFEHKAQSEYVSKEFCAECRKGLEKTIEREC